jgi:putative zinc finger/helix-turn-helix YgiT family protein
MQMKMKCSNCGELTVVRPGQSYHYTESGLNNVYLENIELRVCESCGAVTPRIPRILQLHETIARAIVSQPNSLSGPEIRFLRKQLGLKAKEFAAYLRTDVSTYSRWENDGQPISPQSDLLIRLMYLKLLREKEPRAIEPEAAVIAPLGEEKASVSVHVDMNNTALYSYQCP